MQLTEISQILGNFGEFVGAIAVVATLIYLSIQVRHSKQSIDQSNQLAEVAAMDESLRSFSAFRLLLASDPDVARIWDEGRNRADLSETDRTRFFALVREYHNIMRTSYVRRRAVGQHDVADSMVDSWARQLHQHPGLRDIVQQQLEVDLTGFNAALDEQFQKIQEGS